MHRLACLIVLLLAACAPLEPTRYGPVAAVGEGGYSETRLDGGRWRIAFAGNERTPREALEAYALYRAAEVADAEGYKRFAVIDRAYERLIDRTYAYRAPPDRYLDDRRRLHDTTYLDRFSTSRLTVREERTATLVVVPYRGDPPADAVRTEAADAVKARLEERVRRPAAAK